MKVTGEQEANKRNEPYTSWSHTTENILYMDVENHLFTKEVLGSKQYVLPQSSILNFSTRFMTMLTVRPI